ncbi:MAG: 1-deoxy-D-xylulose-5-phosphate reductoisomerase [Clostridiales bacterium]|jgi:1-deoxy-D-xylulose-5-phosphate reductoisomerase|nr:1-deoxy-D-xylulose-5-phosphate reductoisomerase [Eubacteriales bacterium]MDH7564898.1 1-deoxy-D-xylulose-5-phosphate reductoisomerase [Clostridiales bacterium]
MAKNISILGSTGSIGTQTLEVARSLGLRVCGLSANTNIDLLEKQALEFRPQVVAVGDEFLANKLKTRLAGIDVQVLYGMDGLKEVAAVEEADTVVTSVVGIAGLIPTMEAIKKGKHIALANKETLVTAGQLVMAEAKKRQVEILPVDSEHSAIFQSLMGNNREDVSKIILTASGGPFRGKSGAELEKVSLEQALRHPNWTMGSKITIDSATLMNKGLEVIEAKWLFGIEKEQIQVVVHPQSVIHSMVEYRDGSVIAQMGPADMKIPIQFALTYPKRALNHFSRLNFLETGALTFEEPDTKAFPCLRLAFEALEAGGTMPTVMNGANEIAVSLFLKKEIGFLEIPRIIEKVMSKHVPNNQPGLDDIMQIDNWARREAYNQYSKNK